MQDDLPNQTEILAVMMEMERMEIPRPNTLRAMFFSFFPLFIRFYLQARMVRSPSWTYYVSTQCPDVAAYTAPTNAEILT